MPISAVSLENAIKSALPVVHLEIEDESDGCGDKFSVVIVSEVRFFDVTSENPIGRSRRRPHDVAPARSRMLPLSP